MPLDNTTATMYAVARGDNVLSNGLHARPEGALLEHERISSTMLDLGLEPDVQVVELTMKVTYTKPKPYKPSAPAEETTEADAAGDATAAS